MRLANSIFLILLLFVPLIIRRFWGREQIKKGSIQFSNVSGVKDLIPSGLAPYYPILYGLRIVIILLLIVALARPQSRQGDESISTEGIDIILTLDVSGSMEARDFMPNRLEAAKKVAAEFIRGRKHDRIGLVIFAAQSATQTPLTVDYEVLLMLLDKIQIGIIQEDRTAIGMALANSVNRLRTSQAKSKVIILLTDGMNNAGEIDPLTAANLAKAINVTIYTIGAGTKGMAPVPVYTMLGKQYGLRPVEIDEETLQKVATLTGGQYFRATDEKSLAKIYQEIDRLEKSKIDVKQYKDYIELFPYCVYAALGLLCVEILLAHTRFRKVP